MISISLLEAVNLAAAGFVELPGGVVALFKYRPTDFSLLVVILPSFLTVKVLFPVTLAYIPTDSSSFTSIDFPALFSNVVISSPYIPAAALFIIVIVPSLIALLPASFA